MHEGHVVRTDAQWRNDFTEHLAALAVWLEIPHGLLPRPEPVLESFDLFPKVSIFTMMLDERWFKIEEINVTGGAPHEELNDALGLRSDR
jgi:hypothetical protein